MPSDVTRSKIGDLAVRTEEVLLLLLSDVDDLKEKLEAETGNDQELGVFIYLAISMKRHFKSLHRFIKT